MLSDLKLFVLYTLCSGAHSAVDPVVTLEDGTTLRGTDDDGAIAFKGIRYAQPPVGRLRWAPPEPWTYPNSDEIINATDFGAECAQGVQQCQEPDCSEDCLFLNIYTKNQPSNQTSLPVAIWVYGGTYVVGSSNLYGGANLVKYWGDENPGIVVTINYRLNVFGFLGAEELRYRDTERSSTGNYGIQDQRLAFQWVQENIAAFGGDPNRVTLFGQSAGAGSITQHYVRPLSWGYFNSVIFESGAFAQWSTLNMSDAQSTFEAVVASADCLNALPTAGRSSSNSTVDCLLSKTTSELLAATSEVDSDMNDPYLLYAPVVDGVEATTHPWIALAEKEVADAPAMLGTNRDEAVSFISTLPTNLTEIGLIAFWATAGFHSDHDIAKLIKIYVNDATYPVEPEGYSLYWWAAMRSYGDLAFSCPARYAAANLVSTGTESAASTFMYFFEHLQNQTSFVEHGDEVFYVFQSASLDTPDDHEMSLLIGQYWGSFMNTYDPNAVHFSNGISQPPEQWAPYSTTTDEVMDLTATNTNSRNVAGLKIEECSFFVPIIDAWIRSAFDD